MSTHTPGAIRAPLVLDAHLRARLDKLAAAEGRSTSELANAVLRDFLDANERDLAAIDAGIAEADAGQLLDYDDLKADMLQRLLAPDVAVPARRSGAPFTPGPAGSYAGTRGETAR